MWAYWGNMNIGEGKILGLQGKFEKWRSGVKVIPCSIKFAESKNCSNGKDAIVENDQFIILWN